MNQDNLIKMIASDLNLKQKDVEYTINLLKHFIRLTLKTKGEVKLKGLGTFSTYQAKSRNAMNPITHEKIVTPSKIRLKFRPGEWTKELNEKA